MLGQQEHLPRSTAQEVFLRRFAEGDGAGGRVGAENHHVGEIPLVDFEGVLGGSSGLAVDAAGGEDGMDGCEDYSGGGEEEVTGVVLCLLAHIHLGSRVGEGRGGKKAERREHTIAITPPGFSNVCRS